jgi:transposase-like protein
MIITNKIGQKVETGIMHCDKCAKSIAIAGIKIRTRQYGEYQVQYFVCPYCGSKFHVFTSDAAQRAISTEQQKLIEQIKVGINNRFQKRTIRKYRNRLLKLTDESKKRQTNLLAPIGTRLLEGKDGQTDDD